MIIIIAAIISFLCGSIPTGYLLAKKLYGVDIRTVGSGNIGSTNVKRLAGAKVSLITQIIDVLKGLIPIALGIYLSKNFELPIPSSTFLSIIAIAAILGHDYTPFLGFKGGKGVNTTLGAFILIAPIPILTGMAVHIILRFFTKIVSIRSISLGITLPVISVIAKLHTSIIISTAIACIILLIKHKDNLLRIAHGEEK